MKEIVMLDVDETVVSNYIDWTNWYRDQTGDEIDFKTSQNVEDAMVDHKIDPLDYWKQKDLYDNKSPINGAKLVINKYKKYFDFVFVSNCFSEHMDSKQRFLKKCFGDIPFINTNSKEYVKCDIFIDDRHYYLHNVKEKQPNTECIQIKALYNKPQEGYSYLDWNEIDEFLQERI